MAPSISELGPRFVQPGATLKLSQEGADVINDPLYARLGVGLERGSAVTVLATGEEHTDLQIPDHLNVTIGVPNDMDLFETPPLEVGESVRISTHCAGPKKDICPSESGRVAATFTAPGGAKLANAQCGVCGFTETVGPASRLPPKT